MTSNELLALVSELESIAIGYGHPMSGAMERKNLAATKKELVEGIERLGRELEHARDEARAMHSAYESSVKVRAADETAAWQPIETAPTDGTEILTLRDCEISRQAVAFWARQDGTEGWAMSCGPFLLKVTHWMPLPKEPSEKAGESL